MYVTMDVIFSELEYFNTPVSSPSDHKGENASICDLDSVFGWLDVQDDVIITSEAVNDDKPMQTGAAEPRFIPAETAAGVQQLSTDEECAGIQPALPKRKQLHNKFLPSLVLVLPRLLPSLFSPLSLVQ